MAIFKGKNIEIEIYGQSHSEKIGAIVKGIKNFTFNEEKLNAFLSRRKASSSIFSTTRIEPDAPVFNGVLNGTITGDFSFSIYNKNVKSSDYNDLYGKPRPSHADYAWHLKDNVLDFSGGGRFSGRLTAPLCVVGGICKQYLEKLGIFVYAYVSKIASAKGTSYEDECIDKSALKALQNNNFPALSGKDAMIQEILSVSKNGDSVGGVIECIVYGMPAGVGDNLFEGLEGKISQLIFSVPAVKGVEFGSGFSLSQMLGSTANDSLYYDENGKVNFKTNHSGGINGGISNGNQITLKVAVKPTPSISLTQDTVDLVNKQNCKIAVKGRHDACIVPRAVPCIESAVSIALLDEIIGAL